MSFTIPNPDVLTAAMEFHLLGRVGFDDCLALQRRLVYEAGGRADGRIDVLVCEHAPLITVGRKGSRAHIRLSGEELKRRQLDVRWVNRSGGCVLHSPGQLAIYPIVPLEWHGWTVGEYLGKLQQGLAATLAELNIRARKPLDSASLWGRSGQLASVGVAVSDWVTYHGAFVNVCPNMQHYGFVDVVPPREVGQPRVETTMGCLVAEQRRPVTMTKMRSTLVANLAAAFGCERYHLHTGHPLLVKATSTTRRPARRHS